MSNNAAIAAIEYTLAVGTEERLEFLRCWSEGDFEAIRNEWPDAPKEIFNQSVVTNEDIMNALSDFKGMVINNIK